MAYCSSFKADQVIVHTGRFTADEIFVVAMLRTIKPDLKIIFDNDVNNAKQMAKNIGEIAVDLGIYCKTPNIPCSTAWDLFGHDICKDEKSFAAIRDDIVQEIVNRDSIAYKMEMFNPGYNNHIPYVMAFHKAIVWVQWLIKAYIDNI